MLVKILRMKLALLFGNDIPLIEPRDALETCIEFYTTKQFNSPDWIVKRKAELQERVSKGEDVNILLELNQYCEFDENIKEKCCQVAWNDALIHLLLDFYSTSPIVIERESKEEEQEPLTALLLKHFKFTRNDNDKISNGKSFKRIY